MGTMAPAAQGQSSKEGYRGYPLRPSTLKAADGYTDIDCDLEDAYKGSANKNGCLQLYSGEFPTLAPGENGITLGTGITKVEITPRWWSL